MVCEEALLRNHLNTLHEWISDILVRISMKPLYANVIEGERLKLLEYARSAAKKYANDVGHTLIDMILRDKQGAITYGLQIFRVLVNLLHFFGESFVSQLKGYTINLREALIQAIQPPPRVDWSKLTKQQVEDHARKTGYILTLPDSCFLKPNNSNSAIIWLNRFLWMSRCTLLLRNINNNGTVTTRKHLRQQEPRAPAAAKRFRQTTGDEAM